MTRRDAAACLLYGVVLAVALVAGYVALWLAL